MFRRAVGSILARRFSPPRTASLHSLRDHALRRGPAAGVAAAALAGGGALAYFKKGPDEPAARKEEEDLKAIFQDWIKHKNKS